MEFECPSISQVTSHTLIQGTTGFGKSGLLLGYILGLLRHHPNVGVVVVDLKGETISELVDNFLPSLIADGLDLDLSRVVTVRPFGPLGVPLNPIEIPDLSPAVAANIVVQLIESLSSGFGPRMVSILGHLVRAARVASPRANLRDLVLLLQQPELAQQLAARVSDAALRTYLIQVFPQESSQSRDALRARIEWLLATEKVSNCLNAPSCLHPLELMAPVTTADGLARLKARD